MRVTDSEKLLFVMLSSICKKLELQDEIDPNFVISAICNDQAWALKWKYQGIFNGSESDIPPVAGEVLDILDMWDAIERGYEHLSTPEKEKLKEDSGGREVAFGGFDGNNEAKHYSTLQFIINDLERYSTFKDRDLNTHSGVLAGYQRMLTEYDKLGGPTLGRLLTASELRSILGAR